MTRLISAVMAVALLVSVAPVLAGDSFYALSRLPDGLSPLDDAQLATVEWGQSELTQSNISMVTVTQANAASIAGSGTVGNNSITQSNSSGVAVTQQNSAANVP
jgi:hypothetical protein